MKNFYLKLYDLDGKIKNVTEKTIIGKTHFSAQIDGSFSDFKIQIQAKMNNSEYEVGDFLKIYYGNNIFYEGFIIFINRNLSSNNEFLELTLIPKGNFIANKRISKNYNDSVKNIILDIISLCNSDFGVDIIKEGNIEDTTGNINLNIQNKTYFEALLEILKEVNAGATEQVYFTGPQGGCYYLENGKKRYVDNSFCSLKRKKHFFIDLAGNIHFGENFGKVHKLTLEKNVEEIIIGTTDSSIIKNATFSNSTKLKVNSQYNFRDIKPGDLIKVRNMMYKMDLLKVARINYGDLGAVIDLESSHSFSDLIKKIG